MFPSSYYNKLDPTYREALQKVLNGITYESKPPTYRDMLSDTSYDLILEFASNYLTPKELLQIIWKKYAQNGSPIQLNMMYDFSFPEDLLRKLYIAIPRTKLMDKSYQTERNFPYHFTKTVKDLCFPHNLLESYLHSYEKTGWSHLPQKIFKRHFEMRKLYKKIKSVESNEENWINVMAESDDTEFVKQNIEYKLGQDLTNKKLWNLYFEYLTEYDHQELLQVYSKYCRFFVDDVAMKEEYKKAVEKYGKPTVPWKNACEFENFDGSLMKYVHPSSNYTQPRNVRSPLNFDAQNAVYQSFPFHANLMNCIVKNAKANEIQKLNFSCKHFFLKYRIPVCYKLFISISLQRSPPFSYHDESLLIYSNTENEVDYNNLYISTQFSYRHHVIPLRSIIPKLYRCDAKFISLTWNELNIKELKIFIGHGNVINLDLSRVEINDENGIPLFLEDILALTPKLKYLSVFNIPCSATTAQKLCELPFKNKFMYIAIQHETNLPLDPVAFGEFINKNASPDCSVYVYGAPDDFEGLFMPVIKSYWKTDQKPYCEISNFY